LPISPRTFSTGTLAASKMTEVVEEPWIPSFFSSGPTVTPGKPRSTRKAVKCLRSILAKTVKSVANPPLVMNCLVPSRR
jgi:hypothetical protein